MSETRTTKSTLRAISAVLVLAALGLGVAACGGDSEDGGDTTATDAETTENPYEATETLEEFEERFETAIVALQEADCESFNEFFVFATVSVPCEEPVASDFENFEITGSEEFDGAGAVIEFEAVGGPGTVIATVGPYATFEPAAVLPVGDTVGTELADEEERLQDLQSFIDSLVEEDCDEYFTYALTPSDDQAQECEYAFGPITERTREELAAAEGEPELIGGNGFAAFYTLSTEDPASNRVLYTIPDDEDPHFIANARRVGPPAEGAAVVDRSVAAELLVTLNNDFAPAQGKFLAEIEQAAAAEDLDAMRSLAGEYRDALADLDKRLRELDLPEDATLQVNAVLEAIGTLIGTLDEISVSENPGEAARLSAQATSEDEQLTDEITELTRTLGL